MNVHSLKIISALTVLAAIAATLLQLVVFLTKPIIAENQAEYLRSAIYQTLPQTRVIQGYDFVGGKLEKTLSPQPEIFAAINQQGKTTAYLIQMQGQGYQELIKLLIAYDRTNQRLKGIKVLQSKETPGLGDRIITDRAFLSQFEDFELTQTPLSLTKKGKGKGPSNIDGITGATISSKAVVQIINLAARHYFPKFEQARGEQP